MNLSTVHYEYKSNRILRKSSQCKLSLGIVGIFPLVQKTLCNVAKLVWKVLEIFCLTNVQCFNHQNNNLLEFFLVVSKRPNGQNQGSLFTKDYFMKVYCPKVYFPKELFPNIYLSWWSESSKEVVFKV